MKTRSNALWRAARQRLAWAWGLMVLLGLWMAPPAQAADDWLPTGAITAGAVGALAIDRTAPETLYAGTRNGTVLKSTNGGSSWAVAVTLTSPIASISVQALAIDPTAPGTVYAGSSLGGVIKSINGGTTWASVNTGLPNLSVLALAIDPATAGTVYAATSGGGVFKSVNGGASWTAINNGLRANVASLAIDPANPGTVYAGTHGNGVFKSIDGGSTWTPAHIGMINAEVYSLAIDPAAPGRLYAGTNGGVFKTLDGGATWMTVNSGLNPIIVNAVAIDPAVPGTVYAGTEGGGVFKSRNGGMSWLAINNGLPGGSIVNAFVLDPVTSGTVYVATHGGVFKSINSGPVITPLPDTGQTITLPLPGGFSIAASAQQPGTQVQLVETPTGAVAAVVTAGSAVLQHSVAGQPLIGLPRSGGMAVLTPSCTAARVSVTVTGNTHTAFSEGCAVALSGAGAEVPTPAQGLTAPQGTIRAQDVQLYLPGPQAQRSVLVSVQLDAAARQLLATQRARASAGGFNMYVVALIPGELVALVQPLFLQKHPTGAWGQLTQPLTALMNNVAPQSNDARILIEVLKDTDMRLLPGTEIYVGYGTSDQEMLQAGRYRALYRIQ